MWAYVMIKRTYANGALAGSLKRITGVSCNDIALTYGRIPNYHHCCDSKSRDGQKTLLWMAQYAISTRNDVKRRSKNNSTQNLSNLDSQATLPSIKVVQRT